MPYLVLSLRAASITHVSTILFGTPAIVLYFLFLLKAFTIFVLVVDVLLFFNCFKTGSRFFFIHVPVVFPLFKNFGLLYFL